MRQKRKNSGWWEFLESHGKHDASGDELIQLKREYRRLYEAQYKRNYRTTHQQMTVSFTRVEAQKIARAAEVYGMKEVMLIKRALFGYLNTTYVVQHKSEVDRILQTLLRYQTAILRAEEVDRGSWFKPDRKFKDLERAIADMQQEIKEAFMNPPKLTDLIRQALKDTLGFKDVLLTILSDHERS